MRKITYIFAFISLLITTSLHHKIMVLSNPDIVMIDTGIPTQFSGFMRMDRTPMSWHKHGIEMATALEHEISIQRFDREIFVEHIVWERYLDIPRLIDQAIANNPKIIILALAGFDPILEEMQAIKRAQDANILVVAASGNHGLSKMEYPAGYRLDCLVGVSTKEFGDKYHSANAGEIYLNRMVGEKGTSFSTARAGAIALRLIETHLVQSCKTLKTLMISQFGSTQ